MQPTPETLEALRLLEDQGDYTFAHTLDAFSARAGEIVPDLMGLSFALVDPRLTFTLVSERERARPVNQPAHVGSSLALPLTLADSVIGAISLYAESNSAFVGRQEALATALGADATAVVPNADLGFRERLGAESTVRQIQEHDVIDQAVGFIASAGDTGLRAAEELLREAAEQSGISKVATAAAVLQRRINIPRRGTPEV